MSDIVELRHTICDSSSSSSSSSSGPPKASSRVFVAPPPAPVKVKSIPQIPKKTGKEPEILDRRGDLFVKINNYLTSKTLAPHIADGIKSPSESASLETLEAIYKQIIDSISGSYKRMMVDMMFEEGVGAVEEFLTRFLQMEGMMGLSEAVQSERHTFSQELEEIAIEMDASMVPGPKVRLGMKLLRFIGNHMRNRQFLSQENSKRPEQHSDDV